MKYPFTIINMAGPYREPREPILSYDYAVQRPDWPTPHGVRVKVSMGDELEYCKNKVLVISGGTPGQQMLVNQILTRRIADRKLQIANEEGLFLERFDVMIGPFTGPLQHLFSRLEAWMHEAKLELQQEILIKVGLKTIPPSSTPIPF
jgi:hypothetical protein